MAPAERMPLAEQKAEMLLERIRSAECPPDRPLSQPGRAGRRGPGVGKPRSALSGCLAAAPTGERIA